VPRGKKPGALIRTSFQKSLKLDGILEKPTGLFCIHMVSFKLLILTDCERNNMSNVLGIDVGKAEIMVALLVDDKCIGKESFVNNGGSAV
jgi:hypothetical protein